MNVRRTRCNDLAAQRTHAHKGACGQFEVFGNAAVELQTQVHIGFINPFDGIACTKKAFIVKGAFGFFGVAPVAWCDVGAAVTHFGFATHVDQFQFQPWGGHAQVASVDVRVGDKNTEGARLGHAKTCAHHNALADFALLRFIQAVPNGLCQRGACIEEHLNARQQSLAQQIVGLHGIGNGLKTCWNVEINSRCNFTQVAQGLVHERRRGLAIVDVHRAAMKDHHAKVVVAAKGMVPGQPVHQDQRRFGQDGHGLGHLLLVGAPQTLRVDHRFGQLGRATGEQEFDNRVGACGCNGGINLRSGRCTAQAFKSGDLFALHATFVHHNFHVIGNGSSDGLCIARIAGKHQTWRDGAQHVFELVVVLAD